MQDTKEYGAYTSIPTVFTTKQNNGVRNHNTVYLGKEKKVTDEANVGLVKYW